MTQKQLAEKLGIHVRLLQKYEAGESTANVESLLKIASFFRVSLDFLCGLSDDPRRVEDLIPDEHAAGSE